MPAHSTRSTAAQRGRAVGRRASAVWWSVWLVLALVLAPALGQMHRAVHGDAAPALSAHSAHGGPHAAPGDQTSWVAALFSGHHLVDCQLLDQLTLGDAPRSAPALAHAAPATAPPAGPPAHCSARRTAAFQARAPPLAMGWGARPAPSHT